MTISNYTDEQLSARLGAAIRPENRASLERLSAAIEPRFIRCSTEKAEALFCFKPESWLCNPAGGLHGGIIATIFDNAMGTLVATVSQTFTPTISMDVDFMRPIRAGDDVYVLARLTKLGRSIAFLAAEMYLSEDLKDMCAGASGVYSVAGAQHK